MRSFLSSYNIRLTPLFCSVDKVQNLVELSLRKNAAVKEASIEYSDLAKGQVIRGVVKRVEAYGAFIRIEGSNISGLCHKSKVRSRLRRRRAVLTFSLAGHRRRGNCMDRVRPRERPGQGRHSRDRRGEEEDLARTQGVALHRGRFG